VTRFSARTVPVAVQHDDVAYAVAVDLYMLMVDAVGDEAGAA
jgi:hypothetical protein